MIDFTTTDNPAARRVYELMMEALRVLTPGDLVNRVIPELLGMPGLTEAQRLAMQWMAERYRKRPHGSEAVNGLLQFILYGRWEDELGGASEAGALTDEQRMGVVLVIGETARQVLTERVAALTGLTTGAVEPFEA